jgi:FkbM family methyltransferase
MRYKLNYLIKNNKFLYRLFIAIDSRLRKHFNWYYDSFIEIFSNVEEGSLVVTLNNIHGRYEIDSRSHILQRILITKEYEPITVDLIKKYTIREKDAINIGANIGLFTNLLADLIDENNKVLSIEPIPGAFKYLGANIERNRNKGKIITYQGIAFDKPGIFKINLVPGNEEYSSVGEIVHPAMKDHKSKVIEVNGDTIDHLVENYQLRPGIIVIDVEGAELQVLSGAINTIEKYKPIIITELDDLLLEKLNSSSDQIIKILENSGYIVRDIEGKKLKYPFTGNIIASLKD